MANVNFHDYEPRSTAVVPSHFVQLTGAVLSVGLLAGLGVWGYKLAVRDVSEVPVIRALAGPMRVAPETPGGTQAANIGLAVNDVQAVGEAAPASNLVVLAPRPVELYAEDAAPAEVQPVALAATVMPARTIATAEDRRQALAQARLIQPGDEAAAGDDSAQVDMDADGGAEVETATAEAELPAGPEIAFVSETAPGIRKSPRPLRRSGIAVAVFSAQTGITFDSGDAEAAPVREASIQSRVISDAQPVRATPAVARAETPAPIQASLSATPARQITDIARVAAIRPLELSPEDLSPGTRLVQLGAYDSPETARSEWDRISASFSSYMGDKQRVIQEAKSGGRTFYRLRVAGFDGLSDARRFCSVLLAEKAACIPVVVR